MTKHSIQSVYNSKHSLDWNNRPFPFKIYNNLPFTSLSTDFPDPTLGALTSISSINPLQKETNIDVNILAELLYYTGGITRILKTAYEDLYMRAASATGALYPIEIYVVCQNIKGLEAGVYHFGVADFILTKLRSGNYYSELLKATANEQLFKISPVSFIFTSLAWRNSWKYETRSYRHWYWDCGVMIANLLATVIASGFQARVVTAFQDKIINTLLCLEEKKEASVVIVPIILDSNIIPELLQNISLEKIQPSYISLSKKEFNYPEIWEMHEISAFGTDKDVIIWRKAVKTFNNKVMDPIKPFVSTIYNKGDQDTLMKTILRRGSTRQFAIKAIPLTQLSTILSTSSQGIPLDSFANDGETWMELYLIVNAVEGLEPGSYYYDRNNKSLIKLRTGNFRKTSGHLCLGQELFAQASVTIFIMTRLDDIITHFGDRSYRVAQLEGGIIAGKIYLSAYAQQIGASGSTFFDDDVTTFFSPHAQRKDAFIALGIGIPNYKAKPGKKRILRLSQKILLNK